MAAMAGCRSALLWSLFLLGSFPLASSAPAPPVGEVDISIYGPWQEFRTEPTFKAAIITSDVKRADLDKISHDHLFVTLRTFRGAGPWGPQIFDYLGNLVFYAEPNVTQTELAIQDPHVCTYWKPGEGPRDGSVVREYEGDYICGSDVVVARQGHLDVQPKIYDSSYNEVAGIESMKLGTAGSLGIADGHEFHMLGETLLSTVYHSKFWNLSDVPHFPHGPDDAPGMMYWVYDACFREVDIKTSVAVFEWCWLDYFDIAESPRDFNDMPTEENPWDFGHINSVDKDAQGDYLISLKATSEVMKIAGPNHVSTGVNVETRTVPFLVLTAREQKDMPPGATIWRMGGLSPTVVSKSGRAQFRRQHHVRWHSSELEGDVVTSETMFVFDNHCGWVRDEATPCTTPSKGKLVRVDQKVDPPTSEVLRVFDHPQEIQTSAGGNVQLLIDRPNVWIGWGQTPEASEYDMETGRILQHIKIGSSSRDFLYRAPRGRWVGKPKWSPKIFAQEKRVRSTVKPSSLAIEVWASWNGATEVDAWRVQTSCAAKGDSWSPAGTFAKEGFETKMDLSISAYSLAAAQKGVAIPLKIKLEALDSDGEALPAGEVTDTLTLSISTSLSFNVPEADETDGKNEEPLKDSKALDYQGEIAQKGSGSSEAYPTTGMISITSPVLVLVGILLAFALIRMARGVPVSWLSWSSLRQLRHRADGYEVVT